jgi:deazaflavin-dependent oxidoreductase (nitroreductase family)
MLYNLGAQENIMKNAIPKSRWWHGVIKKVSATHFISWLLADNLHWIDRPFLRLSGGRTSLSGILAGLPVVVLTATGAKSGKPRSMPLAALFDEDKVILIASYLGSPRHPAWYHNLKANPKARVEICGKERVYIACEAEGEDYERYWAQAIELYHGYEIYRKKVGKRKIPVMVLTPEE